MDSKGKIIVVDHGIFLHRAIFSLKNNPSVPATYTYLSMLLGNLKRIGVEKEDKIIIAVDFLKSWRREYETEYKANRPKQREDSGLDFKYWYGQFNELLETLEIATSWFIIKYPHCLAGDTRILVPNSNYIHIKNIKEGQEVLSYNFKTKKIETSIVKNIQPSESYHRYNIYFEGFNLPLRITGEHPVYTLDGWKLAKKLKIGDIIWHHFDSTLTTNIKWHQELGYLYGYILGDGHIDRKRKYISIEGKDIESIKYLKAILRKIFNIRVNIHTHYKTNPKWNTTYSINIRHIERIYSLINMNKIVNTIEYKKGFIGGFFDAEGTYNNKRNIIRITNTQEILIDYIKEILNKINISTKKYCFKTKIKKHKDIFALDINGQDKIVSFFQKIKTVISRKKISTISNGLKIKKIEFIQNNQPYKNYNFECQPNNNYFANGLLVHNCEADDIAAVCCKYYRDNEIVLISYDADWEQCWSYDNVKIFSPLSKKWKIKPNNFNLYSFISKKIEKEVSDNMVTPILNEKDYQNRLLCVDLINLPEVIENPILDILKNEQARSCYPEYFPFEVLRERYLTLCTDKSKIIDYNKQIIKEEKKKVRKKNERKSKAVNSDNTKQKD
jgi:hypothetical protein